MKIHFMLYKAVSLVCFIVFMVGQFSHKGYSHNEWMPLGVMTLRKPTVMANFPVELVRISF